MIPTSDSYDRATIIWLGVLALAGLGGSLVISCLTPFVALAVTLAGTGRLRTALAAMTALWLTTQVIGFAFLDFPLVPSTILWGLASGAAALIATIVARVSLKRTQSCGTALRLGNAFLVSYAAYELSLAPVALVLESAGTFAPAVILEIGLVNLAWLVGLVGLNELFAALLQPLLGRTPRLAKA